MEVGFMLTEKEMDSLDAAFVSLIDERRLELGLSETMLGQKAFPFTSDPRRKIQSIRKQQGTGKYKRPQKLRFAEVLNLLEALGMEYSVTLGRALERMKGM